LNFPHFAIILYVGYKKGRVIRKRKKNVRHGKKNLDEK
jgi:hypothetical protein